MRISDWSSDRVLFRSGLLNLAPELGNVSRACKVMGFSRDTFYRYQSAIQAGGVEALLDANRKKPNLRNRVDETTEAAVALFALEQPALDRKSVVSGKSVSVRVDLGSRRIHKKKKKHITK